MNFVNANLKPLTNIEIEKFNSLKNFLLEKRKEGNLLFLYRGEQFKSIKKRLTKMPNADRSRVFINAFYFGEKARHYSRDRFNINDRNYLHGINDCSEETVAFIFDRIAHIINDPSFTDIVESNTSLSFRRYFRNPNNQQRFINNITRRGFFNEKLRLMVRDYYLYFLHIAGSRGIRQETMFVSTSLKKNIAINFAQSSSRILFHYFVPQPYYKHIIAPWIANDHHRIAFTRRLPTYQPLGLFPEQQEVSVKGALFPHFILGIELIDEDIFVINDHIADINEDDFREISQFGIPIDQTDFEDGIFNTDYIRWGQVDNEGNFEQFETEE